MKKTVDLFPVLAVSHFIPMMELADFFLKHDYTVAVALIMASSNEASAAAVERVVSSNSSNSSISFHKIPPVPQLPPRASDEHILVWHFKLVRLYNDQLHSFLCSIPIQNVHAVVIDAFSVDALDVGKKLAVPTYTFFASGASALAVGLQLPSFFADDQSSFKDIGDTPLYFYGVPQMSASHLNREMFEHPESDIYKTMMSTWHRNTEADGILVATFESFETRAVRALRDPRCLPGRVLPPVYCVGPLVNKAGRNKRSERHECLAWLDAQPDHSVLFLCFGSLGAHSEEQLKEMAVGLEKSEHRFLWVVRAPPRSDDPFKEIFYSCEPNLDGLLPEGFLKRTKSRGLVVKSWAPQVDVLHHRATGAFVTHCGWNSVMEAITAGVPMLCWPLYAEQKMNKVFMVDEMRVGVEMVGYNDGFVKAAEVEAKIKLVMESKEGRELRERVMAHKEGAAMALTDGGSSQAEFIRFLSDVENLAKMRA